MLEKKNMNIYIYSGRVNCWRDTDYSLFVTETGLNQLALFSLSLFSFASRKIITGCIAMRND